MQQFDLPLICICNLEIAKQTETKEITKWRAITVIATTSTTTVAATTISDNNKCTQNAKGRVPSVFIYAIMQRQLGQLNIYFYTWPKSACQSVCFAFVRVCLFSFRSEKRLLLLI